MAEMKPGREMDAAIGVLLGWKWMAYGYTDGPKIALYSPQEMEERAVWTPDAEYPREKDWDDGLPHYSTSDADALAALNKVTGENKRIYAYQIAGYRDGDVWCVLQDDKLRWLTQGRGKSMAEAICRALLALAEKEQKG